MKEVGAFYTFLSNKALLGTSSFKSCHFSAALANTKLSLRSICVFIVSLYCHCAQIWLSHIFFASQEYF